jgi:TolB-like protein
MKKQIPLINSVFRFGLPLSMVVVLLILIACTTSPNNKTTDLLNDRTKTGIFLSIENINQRYAGGLYSREVSLNNSARLYRRIDVFINNRLVGTFNNRLEYTSALGIGYSSNWNQKTIGIELDNGNHTMYFSGTYIIHFQGVSRTNHSFRTDPITFNISSNRLFYDFISDTSGARFVRNEPIDAFHARGHTVFDRAIVNSFYQISRELPSSSTIVIDIGATSRTNEDDAEFILEELTTMFVSNGHEVVARGRTLAAVQREQDFQMSGAVSDDSWVSIGQFLGANVVITGSITGEGERRTLRLRAIDVRTSRILVAPSERLQ